MTEVICIFRSYSGTYKTNLTPLIIDSTGTDQMSITHTRTFFSPPVSSNLHHIHRGDEYKTYLVYISTNLGTIEYFFASAFDTVDCRINLERHDGFG